ncbi:MAG TPA: hypothetical protein VN513_01735 [Gemmatimonadales bacterium]|nr:hypothetical protein [Gemmatimonadales bacterium]
MSESTIAQIHPVFGDILTRFGLPPRDPSLMTDQHDPATQPSLQGQRVMPKAALGTNVCIACERQSPVYALWPSCRSCSEEFCPACQQPGSIEEDEGRQSCLCPGCAADEAAVAADEPPVPADSVLVDQVAAVLVRCLAAAKGEQPQAFDELPPAERQRYRDVARIAWALCDPEAIRIAHWIAADRLIWERTGCYGWKGADGKARRQAWGDARLAVTSARQFWTGLLSSEFAAEARRALAEMEQGKVAAFVPSAFLGGQ